MADDKKRRESDVQGEGDKRSARKFNENEQEFIRQHDPGELARKAQPQDRQQEKELERAEEEARQRAKEHDPNEVRRKGPS